MINRNTVNPEFFSHFFCGFHFMLIMLHHEKLPADIRGGASPLPFLFYEEGDVVNDFPEIPSDPVLFIALLGSAVDGKNEDIQPR